MKDGPRHHIKLRRHRDGRTDYRNRLKLLKSRKVRIVVRKSLKNIRVQFVEYSAGGDKILVSTLSSELKKNFNWKYSTATTSASYLAGLIAGKKAIDKGITEGILDLGRNPPTTGNTLFAAVKGIVDAGIKCPYDPVKIPADDRILGKHFNKEISPIVEKIKVGIVGGK